MDSDGLPTGFTVDADEDAAPADDNAESELPSGFKLDTGHFNSPSQDIVGAVDTATSGILGLPHAVAKAGVDLYRRAAGAPLDAPSWADSIPTPTPTPEETNLKQRITASPTYQKAAAALKGTVGDVIDPNVAGDIATIGSAVAPFLGTAERAAAPALDTGPALTAEENLARQTAGSAQNMGAAAAAPSLEGVSPPLKAVIANAKNINQDAMQRHVNADTLPMPEGQTATPLRKGQATRDDQQISDEKNMRADPDTQGLLTQSINGQNDTMGASMGEIRQRATPDIVQRSNVEHGQSAIDAIKSQDNNVVTDIRSKYKALADANQGSLPLDAGTVVDNINSALDADMKVNVAAEDPTIKEVMARLTSGKPLSFSAYDSAIKGLSEVQRDPMAGQARAAAGIVRNQLEQMPLSEAAANLKGLRDVATSAAKNRFDTIEQNPAYEAVVNDNVPKTDKGLHKVGAPSPLADSFMNTYFLGDGKTASGAYVDRIKSVMQNNPDFAPAIEASSLNKLRDAAKLDQYDSGNFASASFRNAHNAMAPKADVLMSPQTIDNLGRLRQYSDDVSYEGKASTTNRSNTALTLQRFGAQYPATPGLVGTLADWGTDLAAAHTGPLAPLAYGATKIGKVMLKGAKDTKARAATSAAKLKFAQDATAPGAGIDTTPASPIITRATGGKVDHEALTERLFQRWKAAQKDADRSTEPLLKFPDESITRALNIAAARPTP